MKFSLLLFATAMLLVNAQYKEETPKESFMNVSKDMNKFSDGGVITTIIGYIVFGVMFVFTVINIFIDIHKRGNFYQDLIDADIQ